MGSKEKPKFCPSCGAEGSLVVKGKEYVCSESDCGRSFLRNPARGLNQKPPTKSKKKSK